MSYTFRVLSGGEQRELPDWLGSSLSFDFSEVGVFTGEYARYGVNAGLLVDKAIIIALWNGVEGFDSRYQIRAGEGDDSTEAFSRKVTGFSILNLFERVVVEEIAGAPGQSITFSNASAGAILDNLLTAAQARGAATGITWDFDATNDSNGQPWAKVISIEYKLGLKYIELMRNLVDQGMVELRFNGSVLQAFNADQMGTDRSVDPDVLELREGLDYEELPRKWTSETQAKFSMTLGDNGIIVRTTDDSVPDGPFGREEMAVSQGGTVDIGTLTLVNQAALERVKQTREQLTRKVIIRKNGPVPSVDYRVSDYIMERVTAEDGSLVSNRYRLRSMVVELDGTGKIGSASITLNDKFLEAQIRTARKVAGIIGGATADGGGNGIPAEDRTDTTTPSAPSDPTLSTTVYIDVNGVTKAILTADWNAPALNTDGTAVTDLREYELQWHYTSEPEVRWRTEWVTDSLATISNLDSNREVAVRVRAWDDADHASAWSGEKTILLEKDTTPPPVPSTPSLVSNLGTITYSWDGLGDAGEGMPVDFRRLRVYMSDTPGFTADASTLIGALVSAGEGIVTGQPGDATRYFKFDTIDRNGNASSPSTEASVVVKRIKGPDLEANSVTTNELGVGAVKADNIDVDALRGKHIVGAWILTADSGPRFEILGADSTGYANVIEAYTARPEEISPAVFRVDDTDGGIQIVTSDFGVGTPARIQLLNSFPAGATSMETWIDMYGQTIVGLADRYASLAASEGGHSSVIDLYSLIAPYESNFDYSLYPSDWGGKYLGVSLGTATDDTDPNSKPMTIEGHTVGAPVWWSARSANDDPNTRLAQLFVAPETVQAHTDWWSQRWIMDRSGLLIDYDTTLGYADQTEVHVNMVPGGFSADANADGRADGWSGYTSGSFGTATFSVVSGAQRVQGSAVGQTTSDRVGVSSNLGSYTVQENANVLVRADIKAALAPGHRVVAYIGYSDEAGGTYPSQAITLATASQLNGASFTTRTGMLGVAPTGATKGIVYLWVAGDGVTGGAAAAVDAYFDNVTFECAYNRTEPLPYFWDGATLPEQVAPDATVSWDGTANASPGRLTLKPEYMRNLIANPSFETNTTGWVANGSGSGTTIARDTARGALNFKGTACLKVVTGSVDPGHGAATDSAYANRMKIIPGRQYGARARMGTEVSRNFQARMLFYKIDGTLTVTNNTVGGTPYTPVDSTELFTLDVLATAPPDAHSARVMFVRNETGAVGDTFYVDDVMMREVTTAKPWDSGEYFDGTYHYGSFPYDADFRWTGTAHLSQSVLAVGVAPLYPIYSNKLPHDTIQFGSAIKEWAPSINFLRVRPNASATLPPEQGGEATVWRSLYYLYQGGADADAFSTQNTDRRTSGVAIVLQRDEEKDGTYVESSRLQVQPKGQMRATGSDAKFMTDTAWTVVSSGSFTGGWSNLGGANVVAGYKKDASGMICLRGLVKGGSTTNANPIFTLPVGYRPTQGQEIFIGMSNATGFAYITVQTDGKVSVIGYGPNGSNAWVSLAGIRFDTI